MSRSPQRERGMGIWGFVSSATEVISGGVARSREIVGGAAGKARVGAVLTSQAVVDRMPDRDGWERIGRLGLRIADHAIAEGTKHFAFGIPVYKFAKEELSKNKSQEQPAKEKKENMELVEPEARIEDLEKENRQVQTLKKRKG